MAALIMNESNFDETIKNNSFVVVDMWAEWCGPCRMISPVIEELAERYSDKIIVGKVNVDEEPQLAQRFGVTGIPTLLFFKNGKLIDRSVGALPKSVLENRISSLL